VQQFPTTLFHKDLAPEGQVFMTEADVPSEAGWVDTPAAFVAGYKKPVQVVAADAIPADAPAGFVPQPYPSVRYRLGDEASARTVTSAEEDAELEAAEPGVWKHSPRSQGQGQRRRGRGPRRRRAGPERAGRPHRRRRAVVLTDAQKAEVHAAKAADLFAKVSGISSPALLAAIAAAEDEKPGGARVTVLKAVKARLAELKVSAE
jgi:hypothetical protein